MKELIRINRIVARLAPLSPTLYELCGRTGVHYGTVKSWLAGTRAPNMRNYEQVCATFEAELDRLERDLLVKLVGRHPETALDALNPAAAE